jgi:hypothetical protein
MVQIQSAPAARQAKRGRVPFACSYEASSCDEPFGGRRQATVLRRPDSMLSLGALLASALSWLSRWHIERADNCCDSSASFRLVRCGSAQQLTGVASPVELYRLVRPTEVRSRIGVRGLTPFGGRDEELRLPLSSAS